MLDGRSSALTKQVVQNLARAARQEAKESRTHIQLRNLPPSAIPADVHRLVTREKLQGVSGVALDYYRFRPTGRAYLTLNGPHHLQYNIAMLQKATMSALPITALPSPPPKTGLPARSRGVKGRHEAVNRGITTGNGPQGGLLGSSRNVVLWGLPGKLTPAALRTFLKDFSVGGTDEIRREVMKVNKAKVFTLFSRHLVRLSSTAEAHRLVRLLHMTYFEEAKWGKKYQIRARVTY